MTAKAIRIWLAAVLLIAGVGVAWAQVRTPPYFASISAGEARMRSGPGRNYPVEWLYLRSGLPVRVVETYPGWRKVEDPGGTTGWMQANLLTDTRTAIVTGRAVLALRDSADPASPVRYRVEPGVIGQIARCTEGWCRLDVRGRAGYIEVTHLWGVEPGETVE